MCCNPTSLKTHPESSIQVENANYNLLKVRTLLDKLSMDGGSISRSREHLVPMMEVSKKHH